MHKSKKKTAKIPKPIKVKKEKNDEDRLPQPMTHYIDDRLELVKQVFGSLKPKTIINLAPDFLKSQGLEEIEEACLNELLCISTKRLKSIITATRCPTDTESSDDDDVQRQEEHVSLEEISSDSEIEGGSKKVKKKKLAKSGEKDKTGAKVDAPKTNDANTADDGQISVLELLELQARARAIRSQLALEPVTKIEVDSDEEDKKKKSSKKEKKSIKTIDSTKNERKRTSSIRESQDSTNTIPKSSETNTEQQRKTKKIKLKRNYRNSSTQNRDDSREMNDEVRNKEIQNGKDQRDHCQEKVNNVKSDQTANEMEKIKREKSSRSPSPDVIPIVPEPETLLIDDSTDEEEANEKQPSTDISNGNTTSDLKATAEVARERKESEIEDGELNNSAAESYDESADIEGGMQTSNNSLELNKSELHNEKMEVASGENLQKESDQVGSAQAVDIVKSENIKQLSHCSDKEESNFEKKNSPANTITTSATSNPPPDEDEDEDQNDDIISLGEDLEDEMDEQLESEVNSQRSSFVTDSAKEDTPVTTKKTKKDKSNVTSSEDDHSADNQSWHSRYMKSSKVSKVLAASRLGKRVRDKIKKSKDAPRESSEKAEKAEDVFMSKHEDGSLEQYKELLELRQRKSK